MADHHTHQKGHTLQFCCQNCREPISFSLFELEKGNSQVSCSSCCNIYAFTETLRRQIKKSEALCMQIRESEEILSDTSVGVKIGDREVSIPYKLLLTRLSSSLDLMIGEKPVSIIFRIEPLIDIPAKGAL